MKTMLEKLSGIEERFIQLDQELAEAGEDYQKVADLARERSELEPIITGYRQLLELTEQFEEAQTLMESDDDEMRQLAEMEASELEEKIAVLNEELKRMLVPRDPGETP